MAVTFTQVPVKLRIGKASLASVIDILDLINSDNPNNIYDIDTSFHIGSIEQADTVEAGLNTLKDLGVIDTYQWTNTTNQIAGFKRLYLQ
jgi:predicted transcriptional regulator